MFLHVHIRIMAAYVSYHKMLQEELDMPCLPQVPEPVSRQQKILLGTFSLTQFTPMEPPLHLLAHQVIAQTLLQVKVKEIASITTLVACSLVIAGLEVRIAFQEIISLIHLFWHGVHCSALCDSLIYAYGIN